MPSYDFAVIIAAGKLSHEQILDATDAWVKPVAPTHRCVAMQRAWSFSSRDPLARYRRR